MAYGPGVDEINYSDLPPTGDTVNSAFQKTQNQFDALYTGLNNDIVRASEAEVNTATGTTKLVTPGTLLKGKVNGVASLDPLGKVTGTELPSASSTTKGIIELATPAEVLAGTDAERAVTPDTLTDKILGTVSQSGGVPTGAIIESGSNANGEYVKFADGTMICTGRSTQTLTTEGYSGAIYYKQMTSPTFPATFISVTGILASVDSVLGVIPWIDPNSFSNSSVSLLFCASGSFTNLSVIGRYVAIGRWF